MDLYPFALSKATFSDYKFLLLGNVTRDRRLTERELRSCVLKLEGKNELTKKLSGVRLEDVRALSITVLDLAAKITRTVLLTTSSAFFLLKASLEKNKQRQRTSQ